MIAWLNRLFTRRPVQRTFCWCPSCNRDLVSQENALVADSDFVVYWCVCGAGSRWDFDHPAPILVETWPSPTLDLG